MRRSILRVAAVAALLLGGCTDDVPVTPIVATASPTKAVPPAASMATTAAPRPAGRGDPRLAPCGEGPRFSVLPVARENFRAFRPLGFPQPPIHIFGAKHSSFTINLPGTPPVSGLPVRFPSDATVAEVISTASTQGSGYQLTFYPCREFKSYLFHLGDISPALKAAFAASTPRCEDFSFGTGAVRKCTAHLWHAVAAGEPAGASDAFGGVDWGGVDYRVDLPFANISRYDGDYPHIVSPVEYGTPDLRAQIDDKLGSLDGRVARVAEPRTGTLMQDLPGSAQGNWFTPNTTFMNTQDFSPWLGLLHDYVQPEIPIISMGSSVKGLPLGLYSFTPRTGGNVNRDFSAVKPDGKLYCYEGFTAGQTPSVLNLRTAEGVLLLTMPDATTLMAELQPGKLCGESRTMTAGATRFER